MTNIVLNIIEGVCDFTMSFVMIATLISLEAVSLNMTFFVLGYTTSQIIRIIVSEISKAYTKYKNK